MNRSWDNIYKTSRVIIEFFIWIYFGWSWRLLHGSRSPAFFFFFLCHPILSVCLMTWNRDYAVFCNWKLWDQVIIFPFKQFYVLMVIVIKETDSDYVLFLLPFCLLFLLLLFFLVMSCSPSLFMSGQESIKNHILHVFVSGSNSLAHSPLVQFTAHANK